MIAVIHRRLGRSSCRNVRSTPLRRVAAAFALSMFAGAAHSATSESIRPALASDERVAAALRDLKPNHAVLLGDARVVGDLNDVARKYGLHRTGPQGRNFTIKMAWAPERKRALFVGANHAVPHRLNDVWEFDLGALAWVMLYAPDNSRSYRGLGADASDVTFQDGVLRTKRGGPASIGHTWWGMTYEPEQRKLLFMNAWLTDFDAAITQVGGDPSQRYAGPPLWSFTPQTAQWELIKTDPPRPRGAFGAMLEYIPEMKGTLWHSNNWSMRGDWLYDSRKNAWTDMKPNADSRDFKDQAPGLEQVGYFDPVRRLLVAQRFKDTFHFDPRTAKWRKVRSEPPESEQVPYGHDARTGFYYDPVSGHGLLVNLRASELWAYNPDATAWTQLTPQGDPMPTGNRRLGYFDPAHNALVVIDDTKVWAYRYRTRANP